MHQYHPKASLLTPLEHYLDCYPKLEEHLKKKLFRQLTDKSEYIALEHELVFFKILKKIINQPNLGVEIGKTYQLYHYSVFGYGLQSADNLKASFEFSGRYSVLSFTFFNYHLTKNNSEYRIVLTPKYNYEELNDLVRDREISCVLELLKTVSQLTNPIKQLELNTDRVHDYRKSFDCHVVPAPITTIVIDAAVMEAKNPFRDPLVFSMCEEKCLQLKAVRERDFSLKSRIVDLIEQSHNTQVTLESLAKRLNMSSRSIREKLKSEGSSFRTLIESIRYMIAKQLLEEDKLNIDNIAIRVGYNATSNFNHAFKKWASISPGKYRSRHRKKSEETKTPS